MGFPYVAFSISNNNDKHIRLSLNGLFFLKVQNLFLIVLLTVIFISNQ